MVTKADDGIEETAPMSYEEIAREVIAGHPQGSVRRIALYATLFIFMFVSSYYPMLIVPAIGAGILLATTDQLV